MQRHFAEDEPFISASNAPAGPQPVFVARRADSYAISVDTRGKLRWAKGNLGDDHLICVLSEQAPADYLDLLREKGVSYVVCGASSVDLAQAVDLLGEHFGIRTLLLEGGGHINGAFLEAGLVDEVSLLLVPGIDGRREVPAVFDGVNPSRTRAILNAFLRARTFAQESDRGRTIPTAAAGSMAEGLAEPECKSAHGMGRKSSAGRTS
jgi:riboflavin biosynthesis pyrimidine reductase